MNPNDPLSWFLKGDRDLNMAQKSLPDWSDYPDLICYHCQQAAEKYLKSLLVHHGISVKKTHDLEELLDLLSDSEPSIDAEIYDKALVVKNYSVLIRYPEPSGDPSEADVLDALESAAFFRKFTATILGF